MNIESFEEEPGNDTTLLPREARPIILKLGVVGAARAVLRVDFIAWNPDHHVSKALNFTRASVLRPIWSAEFSRKENEMANYP